LTSARSGSILRYMQTTYGQELSVGSRITRWSDGAPGVIKEFGREGNVWVQWDQSGLTTVVKRNQVVPA
jgi:hypothetical protein